MKFKRNNILTKEIKVTAESCKVIFKIEDM